MSLLARTLPMFMAFCFWSTTAIADERPGAPKLLLGEFGKDAAQCRSYNRNHDNITTFYKDGDNGKFYYSDCLGKQCHAEVLSYSSSPVGFMLKLNFVTEFSSRVARFEVKQIDKNTFTFEGQTFVRCTSKDAVAGIGLQPQALDNDGDYKLYYALAVPRVCPSLEASPDVVTRHLGDKEPRIDEVAQWDVEKDKRDIPGFCKEVLGAFGKNGRVIPNILRQSGRGNKSRG